MPDRIEFNRFWDDNQLKLNRIFANRASFSAFVLHNQLPFDLYKISLLKKIKSYHSHEKTNMICQNCGDLMIGCKTKQCCDVCIRKKNALYAKTLTSKLQRFERIARSFKLSTGNAKELIKTGCKFCGFNEALHIHHIDKNRRNNSIENLVALCPNHHYLVHHGNKKYREALEPKQPILEQP